VLGSLYVVGSALIQEVKTAPVALSIQILRNVAAPARAVMLCRKLTILVRETSESTVESTKDAFKASRLRRGRKTALAFSESLASKRATALKEPDENALEFSSQGTEDRMCLKPNGYGFRKSCEKGKLGARARSW
jgi:hypothetical protein